MREWIEYRSSWGIHDDMPPTCELSWFADAGNARDPYPHVRLTMPMVQNVSSCPYWMPFEDGDNIPDLPEEMMRDASGD